MTTITCPDCGHRIEPLPKEVLRCGRVILCVDVRLLKVSGRQPRRIGASEMDILAELVRHADRVCTKDQLMTAHDLWDAYPGSLRLFIHRLRKLLYGSGVSIVTVHGSGYMLTQRDTKVFARRPYSTRKQQAQAATLVRSGLSISETAKRLDLSLCTVRVAAMRAGAWPRGEVALA